MTNDNERVAYLAGEEGVEVDDVTRADLDELMALLGDETVWAEPGAHLEDAVVAGDRRRVCPHSDRRSSRRGRRRPHAAAPQATFERHAGGLTAAAAVAALAAAGYVVSRGGDDTAAEVNLEATELSPGASGVARLTRPTPGGASSSTPRACRGSTTVASTRRG